jgi:YCII-related domain
MKQLFTVMLRHGSAWQAGRRLEDQKAWNSHAAFMDSLVEAGFVVLGGPLGGTDDVLLIVRAEEPAEIVERLSADPWAGLGLLRVGRVAPWILRLGSLGRARPRRSGHPPSKPRKRTAV